MRFALHTLGRGLALALLSFAAVAAAPSSGGVGELLERADGIKTANYSEFASLLRSLDRRSAEMTGPQQEHLRYLNGWQGVYAGEYEAAIPVLTALSRDAEDVNLRFRAAATVVNALVLATQYEPAFAQLTRLLTLLPEVSDAEARQQALSIAAYLYNQVGEYGLALSYAEKLQQENWAGKGLCRGGYARLEALYRSGGLSGVGPEFSAAIDSCAKLGEMLRANAIRTYAARLHIDRGRADEAIKLLQAHYAELQAASYARLQTEFNSLLARAYRQKGDAGRAREFALRAVATGEKNQFTEPVVAAYRLLYLLAREAGDSSSALSFHEKYSAADKGYLDDVSARQIAYERVKHESVASKLQIDALNNQNEVLQLQRALATKAAETSRLYIALLIMTIAFIGAWAYRTKRSQLHFMKLSQIDGLTGIANRPRFIDLAEGTLDNCRRTHQEVSVVLCDLDHFKSINDRYGHATGDFVLKQTVTACLVHLRSSDIFGRFGGEEFGIVLPGCGVEDARERAEQLRLAIAAIKIQHRDVESSISASFGVASTGSSGYELRQLLAHSDAALYEAKNAGRNCIVLHDAKKNTVSTLTPAAVEERLRGFAR